MKSNVSILIVYSLLLSMLSRFNVAFKLDLNLRLLRLGTSLLGLDDIQGRQLNEGSEAFDPDTFRDLPAMVFSRGYPIEEHDVETKDGHILGVKRIPHGIKEAPLVEGVKRPVIYMHHGLLSSGCDFVMNGPNQSLAYILADHGYDVWLGNARGNTYSKRHVKYTKYDPEFWQFSWDEIALQDLPAAIDYILEKTGQEQLFYLGHSMGTTIGFALLSEKPEYNDKIKAFIALAPVITVGYITNPIRMLTPFANDIGFVLAMMGQNEFLPNNALIHLFSDVVCAQDPGRTVCNNLIFLLGGVDSKQFNASRLSVYAHHSPAGTSTRAVLQYAQGVLSREFRKFDFGPIENMRIYNQDHPPKYEVETITTPVALLWSQNDDMADPTDVALLKPRIKNLIESYEVPYPPFTHVDFVYGVDANKYVYEEVLAILSKY